MKMQIILKKGSRIYNDLKEVKKRKILGEMLTDGVFHTIFVLSDRKKTGEIKNIYNQ